MYLTLLRIVKIVQRRMSVPDGCHRCLCSRFSSWIPHASIYCILGVQVIPVSSLHRKISPFIRTSVNDTIDNNYSCANTTTTPSSACLPNLRTEPSSYDLSTLARLRISALLNPKKTLPFFSTAHPFVCMKNLKRNFILSITKYTLVPPSRSLSLPFLSFTMIIIRKVSRMKEESRCSNVPLGNPTKIRKVIRCPLDPSCGSFQGSVELVPS